MVLGLRSKHRKDGSVQVNYLIHVQEIKPWRPSKSPASTQSLLLQWKNGDQISGFPSSSVTESRIEFNKPFTLSLTLRREKRDHDKFQKNNLEFYLYEPRKDKPTKGQLLGSTIVNLGDYGIIDNVLTISAPVNCKKSLKPVGQPFLVLSVQLNDNDETNSSRSSLSKQSSMEKIEQESVSEVTNEENDDDLEIASFTDDDDDENVSSHSSQTVGSSSYEATGHSSSLIAKDSTESTKRGNGEMPALPMLVEPSENHNVFSKLPERNTTSIRREQSTTGRNKNNGLQENLENINGKPKVSDPHSLVNNFVDKGANFEITKEDRTHGLQENLENINGKTKESDPHSLVNSFVDKDADFEITKKDMTQPENGLDERTPDEKKQISEDNLVGKFLASRKQEKLRSNTLATNRKPTGAQLKHLKSVQVPKAGAFYGKGESQSQSQTNELVENGVSKSENCRIEMLEEELRETAVIEAGLYCIVAEHGSSSNKVHAPARRLSRFYIHTSNESYEERRANAARAIVSGLVLVSKSCGNDVPRLTFWLSNSVMLRAIIFEALNHGSIRKQNRSTEESDDWRDPQTFIIALEKIESWMFSRIIESVWWQTLTPHMQSTATNSSGKSVGQTSKKSKNVFGNQQQGNFSVELWKKAFKDACERLCPIRAGGHECGCLPVLPRLVMEQLVCRLDVAMFNAILRESAEEMPTDPLSDPIGDLRVLPIPSGRSSFGAGAQLKNAIGTWSRWLTDLFGIEDNDSLEDGDGKEQEFEISFKAFRLLHALSDLMMLPFEMLVDKSTRKEICPTFSATLIKRVVSSFEPDEFSPNPIPKELIESLDAEEDSTMELCEDSLVNFPFMASPTMYSPPPSSSFSAIVGSQSLRRSSSSVLKKSYTSDDELDELDSPLTSILTDTSRISSSVKRPNWTPKGGRSIVRYQLLRQVWKTAE